MKLPNVEVPKWTQVINLDGCVVPDLELRVQSTSKEKELECLELPNFEVSKKIIIFDHKGHVALDL